MSCLIGSHRLHRRVFRDGILNVHHLQIELRSGPDGRLQTIGRRVTLTETSDLPDLPAKKGGLQRFRRLQVRAVYGQGVHLFIQPR